MNASFAAAPQPNATFKTKTARALGLLGLALLLGLTARAQTTILGTAGSYAVMAGSTVTINSPTTTINGNLGAANIAGSGSYTLNGTTFPALTQVSAASGQNLTDLTNAFNGLKNMSPTQNLSGSVLGDGGVVLTLLPGVYKFNNTAQLTGHLTLDANYQSNAVWVFQIGTAFTTASSASVTVINPGTNSVANDGIFWQVGSTATFGANTAFEGNLLGSSSSAFDFGSGATIANGRALTGAAGTITLASNTIDFIAANSGYSGGLTFDGLGNVVASAIPEPATNALVAAFAALGLAFWRRRRVAR